MPPTKLPPEVIELINWCYAGDCTAKETQRIVGDFWGYVPYSTIEGYKPATRERNRLYMQGYSKRPEVRKRNRKQNRERLQPKFEEAWQRGRESALRYALTQNGESLLEIGGAAGDDFGDSATMQLLGRLQESPANEYELADWQRESGHYEMEHNRGSQASATKRKLKWMERNGWIRPE